MRFNGGLRVVRRWHELCGCGDADFSESIVIGIRLDVVISSSVGRVRTPRGI